MKRLFRVGLVLTTVLIFCFATHYILSWHEPHYQGRSLTQWLEQARQIENKAIVGDVDYEKDLEWLACKEAVNSIGTNAIPFLLDDLLAESPKLKQKVGDIALSEFGLRHLPRKLHKWLCDYSMSGYDRSMRG